MLNMETMIDQYSFVTYEIYCEALNRVFDDSLTESFFFQEGIVDYIRQSTLSRGLIQVFRDLRMGIEKIARDFSMNVGDLVEAFKQRDVFEILKAFGFNIALMFRAINEFTKAIRGGLLEVFRLMSRQGVFRQIRSGAIKIDDVMRKYPKLSAVTGIVIAGILLYIWLNMSFIGNLDYDFNFSDIVNALKGTFSLADLFTSPEGLMLIALFGTGAAFGLSIPWLGKTTYNLLLAIVYTGYAKLKGEKHVLVNLKNRMLKMRLK
jgi:hypothetical protein